MWTPEAIRDLRKAYGETQEVFCRRIRTSIEGLRYWEQGRGEPSGPAEEVLDRLAEDLRDGKIRPLPNLECQPALIGEPSPANYANAKQRL
jgi:transcriptional regulator with XRE-family HTH domain